MQLSSSLRLGVANAAMLSSMAGSASQIAYSGLD